MRSQRPVDYTNPTTMTRSALRPGAVEPRRPVVPGTLGLAVTEADRARIGRIRRAGGETIGVVASSGRDGTIAPPVSTARTELPRRPKPVADI